MRPTRARDRRLPRVLAAFGLFAVVEYGAWFAVLLYAYTVGGVALAGVVGVVQLVPAAVLSPLLGSLGDRLPRGAALSGAYAAEAVFFAATAVLLAVGAPVPAVVAASALGTLTVSVARPIHFASLPQLARTPGSLVRANSACSALDGAHLNAWLLLRAPDIGATLPPPRQSVKRRLILLRSILIFGISGLFPFEYRTLTVCWVIKPCQASRIL